MIEAETEIKNEIQFNTDLTAVMKVIAEQMESSIRQNFNSGGRPAWRPSLFPPTLRKSGTLAGSVRSDSGADFAEAGAGAGAFSPKGFRYAFWNQRGGNQIVTAKAKRFFWAMYGSTGDETWKRMALSRKVQFNTPARPFVVVQPDDMQKYVKMVGNHILKQETNF